MPKVTARLGTGMTERGVVRFDAEDPGDIHGLIEAGVHALDRSSFGRLSPRLGDLARRILEEAGLPSDPERLYLLAEDGTWSAPDPKSAVDEEADYLPLNVLVQDCGYPPDSLQGYAAELLMILMKARHFLQAGAVDDAMALAFMAGELVNEAGMKDMFEKDFLAGERVRGGGRKGHEGRYGTAEEKADRQAKYIVAFDAARAEGLGTMDAYQGAAKKFGVSEVTIRRAVAKRRRQPG